MLPSNSFKHLTFLIKIQFYNNDGRYTREHCVCNLLDTNEKKRDAKIKAVCPNCKLPFTKEELQTKEHCFNCGWEFAN